MFKKLFKDYFNLSSFERNSFLVLVILILIASLLNFFLPKWQINTSKTISQAEKNRLDSISRRMYADKEGVEGEVVPAERNSEQEHKLFMFDPNTANFQSFLNLGIEPKVAKTIINYREKGGHFYSKDDLLKIYGLDSFLFKKLKPYILIEKDDETETVVKIETRNEFISRKKIPKVEINAANADQLKELPGIGDVYSKRIVKYRELLGGFHAKSQILEVYGIDSSLLNNVSAYITIDPSGVQTISVNLAGEKTLARHPYISDKLAQRITKYIADNGPFRNKQQIIDSGVLNEDGLKALPYLKTW